MGATPTMSERGIRMNKEQIVYKKTSELKLNSRNPRKNDEAVDTVAKSIQEFGFKNPLIIDSTGTVWCGNTRLKAARKLGIKEVPCIIADDLTEEQIRKLAIIDNKSSEIAEWDFELLKDELADLDMSEFDLDWGIDEALGIEKEVEEDNFDVDSAIPEEPKAKLGDIYQLGEHRLMCGDSTKEEDVAKLMDGEKADMVFTDPPYGMKKENEGVANDNLNYDDLLEFNKKWIPLTFKYSKENGSWYCWGIDEPLMDIYSNILKPMQKEDKITFRNLITWKKENDNPTMLFNGACSSNKRSYYTNEKCLFVMCGVQGFNNNADHYDETFEPIRAYMETEAKKVGLTAKQVKDICGVGMYAHWFTKSQFGIIPQEHYEKLRNYYQGKAFNLEYDELRNLFDDEKHKTLKEAIMAKRAYFDGTQEQCIDVWVCDVTSSEERKNTGGHATPKPIALCSRAIKSSSRENEIVLDVFGGSGSTLIACEQLNRKCYIMELEPKWVDVIIKRYEDFTGKKAVKIN